MNKSPYHSDLEISTLRSKIEYPATYCKIDKYNNTPRQRVYLTGIGEETACGINTSPRVESTLDPLDQYISQNRLARPDEFL